MDFLTAYYRQNDATDTAIVLQQYRWRGRQVCFACVCKAKEERAAAYLSGQLIHWFRELPARDLCGAAGNEKGAKWLEAKLETTIAETDKNLLDSGLIGEKETVAIAGMLCVGTVYVLVLRGGLKGYLLNTFFGRTSLREVSGDLGETVALRIESGIIQENVGVLFATDSFCISTGKELLKEGLRVEALQTDGQVQRHLEELAAEAEQRGGCGMAAIFVKSVTCKERALDVKRWGMKKKTQEAVGKHVGGGGKTQMKSNLPRQAEATRTAGMELSVEKAIGMLGFVSLGELGHGAFAQVYKVKSVETGFVFACKVSEHKELLQREYHWLKTVEHPLFPIAYNYWETGELAVMQMEYVAGESAKEMLRRRKHFSPRQVARMGMALAEGLLYLHEREKPLLFRDLKPENLVIAQDGGLKLLDFGCVCELGGVQNAKVGSPGFAAPEQLAGQGADVTADVYGLGQTLRALFRQKAQRKGRRKKRTGKIASKDWGIHKDRVAENYLLRVLNTCVETDRTKRFPDMRSVLHALMPLCEKCGRHRLVRRRQQGREWRELQYEKNIWETVHKRA